MDEERNDKIFDYSDFEQLHRPYSDWGDQEFNREADDYEDEDEAFLWHFHAVFLFLGKDCQDKNFLDVWNFDILNPKKTDV